MIAMPNEVFLAFIGASVLLGGLLTWFFTGPLIPPRMKAHYDSVWRERCHVLRELMATKSELMRYRGATLEERIDAMKKERKRYGQ